MLQADKPVVLFVDTFNATFDAQNARAAARLLKTAGYRVHLIAKQRGRHCCGRTFLACGMVSEARSRVSALIDALLPWAQARIPIVGLEPACLLTLRDEALVMGLGAKARTVAAQSLLLEEFLAREARRGQLALRRGGGRSHPGARSLPSKGIRRARCAARGAAADPGCET